MTDTIAEQMEQLELLLLHTDMQANPTFLDGLLSHEFEEIGSSGCVTSRQEVVDWLLHKNPNDRWSIENFRVKELSKDLILAIYHAHQIVGHNHQSKVSIRSSIWKLDEDNWKLVFHHASKLS
ncbi:MAG: DUF4440 domain-containing protein [Nitrosomonas sp.]|nr:DUF4440 domain-containing protein [Nitrosomonas sp.]